MVLTHIGTWSSKHGPSVSEVMARLQRVKERGENPDLCSVKLV